MKAKLALEIAARFFDHLDGVVAYVAGFNVLNPLYKLMLCSFPMIQVSKVLL